MVFFVFFLLNKFGDRVFRNSKFQSVLHSSNQIYSNFSLSILAFLNCLVCWSFNVCIMGNLLRAVDPNMSFLHSLYATPPSILGGILPISLWGIGTRDGIFAYCLQQFTAPENSISAGFLYTAHVYWLLGILGILGCLECLECASNSGMIGTLGVCLECGIAWNAWNVLGIHYCSECLECGWNFMLLGMIGNDCVCVCCTGRPLPPHFQPACRYAACEQVTQVPACLMDPLRPWTA